MFADDVNLSTLASQCLRFIKALKSINRVGIDFEDKNGLFVNYGKFKSSCDWTVLLFMKPYKLYDFSIKPCKFCKVQKFNFALETV